MLDVVGVVALGCLFAVCLLYVQGCNRLKGDKA